ncbi:hypothetical protein Dvar_22580 [Desulfosarcina variabilis str. Montpellier]|uniref:hypothetical protein n=1 Tax=Desulfosarcina variabilis TaxID=2300 RepID=UPI003AFAFAD8
MSTTIDRLYELIPDIYRIRDNEKGEPLRALLQVIAEQVNLVEEDIRQLYDNWFIETCEDWVVPYIGDLIGYQPVHEAGEPGEVATEQGRARNKILIPRRDVANSIRYRRRKGTLALLELLANDVAGWPARAVAFHKLLGWTQALNHPRPEQGRTMDLRDGDALDLLDGPFDQIGHTVDVRRIGSAHIPGRHNIPCVGLFVWRLKSYSITHAPAYCVEKVVDVHCYTFSALGNDIPLYTRPEQETAPTTIAGELNLPVPIRRRAFEERGMEAGRGYHRASSDYYGLVGDTFIGKSLAIWAPDWPEKGAQQPVPRTSILPADLSGWQYQPRRGQLAVDPVLGRISFPPRQPPKKGVWVSYHYGFSADMGGGEYDRPVSQPDNSVITRVSGQNELRTALEPWKAAPDGEVPEDQPFHAVIEIMDSGAYVLPIYITLKPEHSLQIRAATGKRPLVRLLDWQTNLPDYLSVSGGQGSRFTLDGMLVAGQGIQVEGDPTSVTIRHSTLVPGWSLDPDCEPYRPAEPSLTVFNAYPCIVIEHSIVGSIQINIDEVTRDPIQIRVSDSIIDATGADCDSPRCEAIGAAGLAFAHARLQVLRSTVIGSVLTHAVCLGENSIFMGRVTVARRQIGCMRFSYVTPGSSTPRRYHCQPDLVKKIAEDKYPTKNKQETAKASEERRVRPRFSSMRYGQPTYCQLADSCAGEIKRGADDESEMGAFHHLYQPQREANLRARLDAYTPAGMEPGIIMVT